MPEAVLPIVFFISLLIIKITRKELHYVLSARIAMSAMLIITGIAHFVYTKGMTMMLPDFVPYKVTVIYSTGILEILAAASILIPKFQKVTGCLLLLFFVLILPSNIYAALNKVNMENATYNGEGIHYLWYRIPLQFFFIAWVYYSCIKSFKNNSYDNI
ncbi:MULTISPECIES: DoxX family protein [unclassified Sphingobacterium]|uniref:DoxX family protein n=1 Tax=unclassified Sphingobacterium TaxID=2609468 RepID=UPI0025FAD47B|nr:MULTISPECIES: hypothetical protein [unclassified Sphingobacterium]